MPALRWCFLGRVAYAPARELQERLAAERRASAGDDLLLLLEHEPIVTVGRSAAPSRAPAASFGEPLCVDRGGRETYHGPGQLVAYPVVALRAGGRGVRGFVAALEAAMGDVAAHFGVAVWTRSGLPGIWSGTAERPAKLGFVGLAVRRGVTLHGCALNVERCAEAGFAGFAPCGLDSVAVSSLERQAPLVVPRVADAAPIFALSLAERLGCAAEQGELAPQSLHTRAAPVLEDHGRHTSPRPLLER